jgi:hypothetical protein
MLRALAAITVMLALAAPQSAAAKPLQVGNDVDWFAVDGSRYAAWGKGHTITAFDTRTHKRHRMDDPPGCGAGESGRVMLGGTLLMSCGESQRLLDVRTGHSKKLPAAQDWERIGSRWLQGIDGSGREFFLSRRTGRVRSFRERSDRRVRDLDDPKLRLVCGDPGYLSNYERFYDRRFTVSSPTKGDERFVLHRRCHAKGRILGKGDFFSGIELSGPFVAAGWVSWAVDKNAYAENLDTRERRHWRVPHWTDSSSLGLGLGQTTNTMFLAPAQTDDGFSEAAATSFDVFAARLPGAK